MIRFQLTEQEVVRGLLKYRKPLVRPWLAIVMAALGVVLVADNLPPSRGGSAIPFYFGCWLIGMSVLVLVFQPLTVRRAFTKVVRANPSFTEEREVHYEDAGLLFSSPNRRSEVTWAVFKRLTEDERYFYLHTDDLGTVTILPKQAFDPAGLESFLRCSRTLPRA